MKKELVYAYREQKRVYALRQSNQTLLVKAGKLFDSDRTMVEDLRGYRYARNSIELEQFSPGFHIFNMI